MSELYDPLVTRVQGISTEGNPFDVPFISQIDGNLWQGGVVDNLLLPVFFQHVISLHPWNAYHLAPGHELLSNMAVKMYDHPDQGFEQVEAVAEWVDHCCDIGPTLVHCQAGLNRSGLIVARVLMMRGYAPADAITEIRAQRSPACLTNQAFEQWLLDR